MNQIGKWVRMISALAIAGPAFAQTTLTITTASPLPDATLQSPYTVQFAATGGAGTLTWSAPATAGSLPPGLTLASSGSLSGTPTKTGAYSFTVNVADQRQNQTSKAFALTVQAPPPVITNSSPLPDGTPTVTYSYVLNATGGAPPYTWRLTGSLPPGLSLSSGGQIAGTPTTVGTYQFSVAVTDSAQSTGTKVFTLTIQPQILTITSTSPALNGSVGVAYSFSFSAAGGTPPYIWSVPSGGLPDGLALAPNGVLSGTPTAIGQFTFTVRVIDSPQGTLAAQVATKSISLRITAPLSVTTPSPLNATPGSSFIVVMTATGGSPPYLWFVAPGSQLPPGFMLETSSGFLSGTPAAAGTFNFTVQATDSAQGSATKALVLIVGPGLAITTALPGPNGAVGVSYSLTLAASGGTPPYTWALDSGALPGGVTLNTSTGVLSGTPQAAGSFSFVIRVTDSAKATLTKPFSVTINSPSPSTLLSTNALDFSAPAGGDAPTPQSFAVNTSGPPALQFTIQTDGGAPIVPAPAWISVRLAKGSTPARIPVAANQAGMQPGKYSARVLVNSSDGRQNIVTVTLTVVADTPQQLDVSPPFLRFAGATSALAAEQDLLVRNTGGGGPLAFSASVAGDAPWLSATPASGQAGPNAPGSLRVMVNAQGLPAGPQRAAIHIDSAAGAADIPVSLLVRPAGPVIGLDVGGVRFEAREKNGSSGTQTANVLDLGSGAVNWQAEIVSAANWLFLGATSGQATPATASELSFSVQAGALAVGAYYALVKISDPGALNSPQYCTVVLNVVSADNPPGPDPDPEGLFFVARAGSVAAAAQSVGVFTSSSSAVPFQASANTADGGNWLSVSPSSGSTSTGATARVNVTVNALSLGPGLYMGDITFALSGTEVRSTNVTLVVQPSTVVVAASKTRSAAGCTPARLALAQTGLPNSFAAPVGWPSALVIRLADDCGDPVINGQVVTTFSNGDPALVMKLTNPGTGLYSATWSPGKTATQVTVTARATAPNLAAAAVDITGSVTPNKVPILATNGTLNNLNPVIGAPIAPGTVAQVYGSSLATTAVQPGIVPLPKTYNGTRMLVGAFEAPLYYLSDGQLNVQIPTELQPGKDYPVVVEANGGYTLPDTLAIAAVDPGVLTTADTRLIAQHADYSLITVDSPASQNEPIMIYLVGMGPTDPSVASGMASPLASSLTQPVVTVGGKTASVFYAGLSPGAVGLYQINLTVPTGLPAGDAPVIVTQGGVVANAAMLPVR